MNTYFVTWEKHIEVRDNDFVPVIGQIILLDHTKYKISQIEYRGETSGNCVSLTRNIYLVVDHAEEE